MITPVTIAANNPIVALENRYEKVTAEKALQHNGFHRNIHDAA